MNLYLDQSVVGSIGSLLTQRRGQQMNYDAQMAQLKENARQFDSSMDRRVTEYGQTMAFNRDELTQRGDIAAAQNETNRYQISETMAQARKELKEKARQFNSVTDKGLRVEQRQQRHEILSQAEQQTAVLSGRFTQVQQRAQEELGDNFSEASFNQWASKDDEAQQVIGDINHVNNLLLSNPLVDIPGGKNLERDSEFVRGNPGTKLSIEPVNGNNAVSVLAGTTPEGDTRVITGNHDKLGENPSDKPLTLTASTAMPALQQNLFRAGVVTEQAVAALAADRKLYEGQAQSLRGEKGTQKKSSVQALLDANSPEARAAASDQLFQDFADRFKTPAAGGVPAPQYTPAELAELQEFDRRQEERSQGNVAWNALTQGLSRNQPGNTSGEKRVAANNAARESALAGWSSLSSNQLDTDPYRMDPEKAGLRAALLKQQGGYTQTVGSDGFASYQPNQRSAALDTAMTQAYEGRNVSAEPITQTVQTKRLQEEAAGDYAEAHGRARYGAQAQFKADVEPYVERLISGGMNLKFKADLERHSKRLKKDWGIDINDTNSVAEGVTTQYRQNPKAYAKLITGDENNIDTSKWSADEMQRLAEQTVLDLAAPGLFRKGFQQLVDAATPDIFQRTTDRHKSVMDVQKAHRGLSQPGDKWPNL